MHSQMHAAMMGHHHHALHHSQGQQQGYDYYGASSGMYGSTEEWVEMVRVSAPSSTSTDIACGAVAFDQCHEMLWVGYSDGRLTSHLLPTMEKYTSVVSNVGAIKQLAPAYGGVVAISDQMAVFRSRGCVQTQAILVDTPRSITCGRLNLSDPSASSDHLLVGLDSGLLSAYDLHGYRPLHPLWTLDLYNATSALASSEDSSLQCAGSAIGQLDFFDGGLRSHRVEASIPNAHSGAIVSMDMLDHYVVTCGVSSRSINPYDKNAPVKIYPDPLVKLFDMRTMGLVSSIPFPSACNLPPSFVKFHAVHHSFFACDAEGELLCFDMADPMQYTHVCQLPSSTTAWDVSLSGELMVAGSADGDVAVYDAGVAGVPPHALLDPPETHLEFPTATPRPPLTLSPLEPAPASRYLFRPSTNEYGEEVLPLSSWLPPIHDKSFKHALTLVVAPKPTRVLDPDFEKKIQTKDTIGYTSHRGIDTRNSFLYGQGRAAALATVDPRFVETTKRTSLTRATKSFDEGDPYHVPASYKYAEIKLNKTGVDGFVFDFSKHNRTAYVGLENSLPFAYMNAALQLLYFTPGVRAHVLGHLCDAPNCVACELGFLYHMMEQTRLKAPAKNKSCQATNFLSALHQISDVAAQGLFDKSISILDRVDRLFGFLCDTLQLDTLHRVALAYNGNASTTFEEIVHKSLTSPPPSAADLLCVECKPVAWLTPSHSSDIERLWRTPNWVPSTLSLDGHASHKLIGVVTAVVRDPAKTHLISGPNAHLVAHVLPSHDDAAWLLINDFCVSATTLGDAVNFTSPWKYPTLLLFAKQTEAVTVSGVVPPIQIPATIFQSPSLRPGAPAVSMPVLPRRGDRIAIDTEFVIVEMEEATLQTDGTRIVTKESRQSLARVSVIHGETDTVIVDDYILPNEPVVDYLTRFSGLVAEDLNPALSRHHVVSLKTAYMKLRYLVDAGCLFVGHGLRKDFRIVNVFVPPDQVIDTVELYQQPNMRKIALRFLCAYLLKAEIQLETHDSIEDARAALKLHNKYLELTKNNEFDRTLMEIYAAGRVCRWKIADLESD
ncbi:Aste57867_12510 [Aphanomyces stellatus]|uniref:Aste57867_12510 protein n=1 Tax=Aphanomyces stellatus TaxID=120398 RepID=A0A485KVT7_9STRA|nr:hypothetical protein As57867_012464 [Aphanomyces stellatus]VFT89361.1 Aste57867_12510 [Aphanomyces stellatus]